MLESAQACAETGEGEGLTSASTPVFTSVGQVNVVSRPGTLCLHVRLPNGRRIGQIAFRKAREKCLRVGIAVLQGVSSAQSPRGTLFGKLEVRVNEIRPIFQSSDFF